LAQDDDDRFALYLNSARGSVATPPHNHTTWAVVVGFAGRELNRFYRRTEQGAVEQIGEQAVEAGSGVIPAVTPCRDRSSRAPARS
jgi:predicted metal-dependent enzyme (double-stranded beta helix superfamily)